MPEPKNPSRWTPDDYLALIGYATAEKRPGRIRRCAELVQSASADELETLQANRKAGYADQYFGQSGRERKNGSSPFVNLPELKALWRANNGVVWKIAEQLGITPERVKKIAIEVLHLETMPSLDDGSAPTKHAYYNPIRAVMRRREMTKRAASFVEKMTLQELETRQAARLYRYADTFEETLATYEMLQDAQNRVMRAHLDGDEPRPQDLKIIECTPLPLDRLVRTLSDGMGSLMTLEERVHKVNSTVPGSLEALMENIRAAGIGVPKRIGVAVEFDGESEPDPIDGEYNKELQ